MGMAMIHLMMKVTRLIRQPVFLICLILSLGTLFTQAGNPVFCTRGITEFFRIVDILKQDKDPTEEDWNLFNDAPGYKELAEMEFGRRYLRDLITVAYKPSEQKNEKEILDKYRKKDRYYEMFAEGTLSDFKEAGQYRTEILDFVGYITSREVIREIEQNVSEYIEDAKLDSTFRINFIVFGDSRGYDPIIIGITNPGKYSKEEEACLKSRGESIYLPTVLLMAHEAFHNIRNRRISYNEPEKKSGDQQIVEILDKIQNEGTGDQINVPKVNSPESCFPDSRDTKRILQEQKFQYAIVHAIDYFLTQIAGNEALKADLGRAIGSMVTRSGHPTGYYMSSVIVARLGKAELKKISTNPFRFFITYNRAAKMSPGTPDFSDAAIAFIQNLENKYIKK